MPKSQKMGIDQYAEFASAVGQSLPRDLVPELAQHYITNRVALAEALRNGLVPMEDQPAIFPQQRDMVLGYFFTPLLDADLPERYKAIVAMYRQEATAQGMPITHPVCYRVRAGFTQRQHAPLAGPCYKKFEYLNDWNFTDKPTEDSYVFWIPGVLKGSTSMSVDRQRQFLAETRIRLGLPDHHMSGLGEVALVAGLVLAHFKATGERISLVLRTNTRDSDGHRLCLLWCGGELYCDSWNYGVMPCYNVGVPALGVELGI